MSVQKAHSRGRNSRTATRGQAATQELTPELLAGRYLGIRVKNRRDINRSIQAGLSVNSFSNVADCMGIPEKTLAGASAITTRTLSRRKTNKEPLSKEESDRLYRITGLFAEVVLLFEGNRDKASIWFNTPKKALGGEAPVFHANTEIGVQDVRDLINRLEHGIFS